MNPGCVANMVTELGLDLLEHGIVTHKTAMFYEITNNDIPVHHSLKVVDGCTTHR